MEFLGKGNQVNWGGSFIGYRQNMNLLGQSKPELFTTPFTPGANGNLQVNQVYISSATGLPAIQPVSSATASFPAGFPLLSPTSMGPREYQTWWTFD
jgi:hypothetical protein